MSLLNNWDLKEVNNSIYEVNGERRYLVSDAGRHVWKYGQHVHAIEERAQETMRTRNSSRKLGPRLR